MSLPRFNVRLLLLLALIHLNGFIVHAQAKKASSIQNQATEAKAVEQTVVRFFDAMRASDSTMARSVLAPNARLYSVAAGRDGKVQPHETPISNFVEMIGQKHPEVLNEVIWDVEVNIDGDFATLWCQYAFYVGDTFSHCGVDAFQLYRSPQGWKIFSITDTRRKQGCDLQAAQAAKAKP